MNPYLSAVVAMTPARIIGKNGGLPWHLPEDLAFFKRTTSGYPIVMGRKTYESIGRPLPKRRNIVLTSDSSWTAPGVEVIHAPLDLFSLKELGDKVFIIGGSQVYDAFLPILDELLVSHVFENYEGDTRFPEFSDAFPVSELLETHAAFEVKRWTPS